MELIDNKTYTIEEYLQMLEESPVKLEYGNGQIYAMAGGSFNHGTIINNTGFLLNGVLASGETKCVVLGSEVKIQIENANSFVFPDGMVICGGVEFAEHDKNAVVNPVLVIEVLSKSTSSYDRGAKFRKYCSLPSFKEYVLIDPNVPIVDTLFRADNKSWNMVTTIGLDKSIHLRSINADIKMEDIYKNTINLQDPPFQLDF